MGRHDGKQPFKLPSASGCLVGLLLVLLVISAAFWIIGSTR